LFLFYIFLVFLVFKDSMIQEFKDSIFLSLKAAKIVIFQYALLLKDSKYYLKK